MESKAQTPPTQASRFPLSLLKVQSWFEGSVSQTPLQELLGQAETKTYKDGVRYYTWPQFGVQLETHTSPQTSIETVVNIFLFVGVPKRLPVSLDTDGLPYGLLLTWTAADLVQAFGEPERKSGGGMAEISLEYTRLGVAFDMRCKVWEDAMAGIGQVVIFKRGDPTKGNCGVCKKPAELRCSSCKLVLYCGANCQSLHWKGGHKKLCPTVKYF